VVPEKQGLKLQLVELPLKETPCLSSGSRKTRIETEILDISIFLPIKSKQWFQKNKD